VVSFVVLDLMSREDGHMDEGWNREWSYIDGLVQTVFSSDG
jgi:hypothetical protein